jgi:hypothetical protein
VYEGIFLVHIVSRTFYKCTICYFPHPSDIRLHLLQMLPEVAAQMRDQIAIMSIVDKANQ